MPDAPSPPYISSQVQGGQACAYHGLPTPKRATEKVHAYCDKDACFSKMMAQHGRPKGQRSKGGFCLLDERDLRLNKHSQYRFGDLFKHPCKGRNGNPRGPSCEQPNKSPH